MRGNQRGRARGSIFVEISDERGKIWLARLPGWKRKVRGKQQWRWFLIVRGEQRCEQRMRCGENWVVASAALRARVTRECEGLSCDHSLFRGFVFFTFCRVLVSNIVDWFLWDELNGNYLRVIRTFLRRKERRVMPRRTLRWSVSNILQYRCIVLLTLEVKLMSA